MCSAWLGHVQLPALSSWEPQLALTVMFFLTLSRGRPGALSSHPMLPFLGHLHEELLRFENTSRASPSPPSRKLSKEDPSCTLPWGQNASQLYCTEHEEESQHSTGTAAAMEAVEIQEWKVQGTEEVT